MRHIPEAELHAYLDQALSRSQCVEIERHLARCQRCQSDRDAIAALRDRTTELLARLGPPPIVPPAFEVLRARRAERVRRRWRWISRAAWAASLFGAVGAGWQVSRFMHGSPVTPLSALPETRAEPPILEPTAAPAAAPGRVRGSETPRPHRRLVRLTPVPAPRYAKAMETDADSYAAAPEAVVAIGASGTAPVEAPAPSAQPVGPDPALQGLWRTIVPDSSGSLRSGDIPLVPGLPVMQMRVQPGDGSSDVTAVDQILESGDVIRTIAGPAARVGSLVDKDSVGESVRDGEAGGQMTVTIRQGDRMVAVTGPSQALGSLLSRVNVKRRRY